MFRWLFAGVLLLSLPLAVQADTIVMKNGRKIIGVIDKDASTESHVVIKTPVGTSRIPRSRIDAIESLENASYTETKADLALNEGEEAYDKALELYRQALANDPENERLQGKVEQARELISQRDERMHGESFRRIEQAIKDQYYIEAIEAADALANNYDQESVLERCRRLKAKAYVGLAQREKDRINYPNAERYYRMAMETDPDYALPLLELAEIIRQTRAASKELSIPLYQKGIALAIKEAGQIDDEQLLMFRYRLGKLYMDEKMYLEAARIFLDVSSEDVTYQYPDSVVLAIRAFESAKIIDYGEGTDEFIDDLESIIKLKPQDGSVYFLLGSIYYRQSNWEKSSEMMRATLERITASTSKQRINEARHILGVSLLNLDELSEASVIFSQLVADQPGNYEALCELGDIRFKETRNAAALELFERAISHDQNRYRAYLAAGYVLMRLDRVEEARLNFAKVVELDPNNREALFALGSSYFDKFKWSEAIRETEKMIKIIKDSAGDVISDEDRLLLAKSYTMMGISNNNLKNSNRARENFEKALEYIPNYAPALDGIGVSWQEEGRHKDAQRYYQLAIDQDPENPDYYLSMAHNLHKHVNDHEGALKFYYEYLRLGGGDPIVYSYIEECGGTPPDLVK